MSTRLGEIKHWLENLFPNIELNDLQYIQADASDRKYLRLHLTGLSFIIMDTKPGPEMGNFIRIANILTQQQLTAPKIISADLELGLILMDDFGAQTYLSELKNGDQSQVNKLYLDALHALIKIQLINNSANTLELPLMDADYIDNRLNVFHTWYLQQHLKLESNSKIKSMLSGLQQLFTKVFQDQPQVFVHLDYHSRNLMFLPSANNPGLLDFQDAMFGPLTYDLVSLFQDAYITWPRAQVENWVNVYTDLALDAGLIAPTAAHNMLRNFDLVGLQRHIKNLGVFARLHYRDKKSNYLHDIPTLLNYITSTCHRYPDLSSLLEFLKGHILEVSL
jgi:aminoglycoside/choline kinase family phosphotransferase